MTSYTDDLHDLITRVRFVLWDFDGPICRLFAGHKADSVARELVRWLDGSGMRHMLTHEERRFADPYEVLRAVDRRCPGSDLVAEVEARLTREELRAASSAMPTPYADDLVLAWAARGARLAVTTNNSPAAARKYLRTRGLESCFGPHIYGRTQDPNLLKPHPHSLRQALAALGADPSDALMVGDGPTDLLAAQQAGVAFIGYARNDRKEELLREAEAEHIVLSLSEVLRGLKV
ncbi:HAD family hydrolase [Streptomyces sp. AC550_RSS872]|uniref:HAD family hydrolase n=1 Tax=Streptomyces sp. AC550_RSS872 TaxID=2823689 RepID=UPI001C27C993|nr:HAD family hydrolase [Streptomyces sp. AC550_RSS872]